MGDQRGGLYSYDWLDRLFGCLDRPSAKRILPEFRNRAVGDTILFGRERLSQYRAVDAHVFDFLKKPTAARSAA